MIKLNEEIYCLFLRGINVGGHGRLPMATLKIILGDLGAREVRTYIQSGNAVFRCAELVATSLPERLKEMLAQEEEINTFALMQSLTELGHLMQVGQVLAREANPGHVHAFLLEGDLARDDLTTLQNAQAASEMVAFTPGAIILHAQEGVARSKFPAAVDKVTGGIVTSRNWRTLGRVRDLAQGLRDDQSG